MTRSDIEEIQINKDLTPQNASNFSLIWVKDAIFNLDFPTLCQEVISLVKSGCQLGQPSGNNSSKVLVGVYRGKYGK